MDKIGNLIHDLVTKGLLPNPITFTAQILATIILFLVLKRLVWEPMKEFLDKRSQIIVDELTSAKLAKEEAETMKVGYQQDLREAKAEANEIIDNARSQALELKEKIIAEAEKEAEYKKEKAKKEIESEKAKLHAELKSHIVDVAITAAEKLVSQNLDNNQNRLLVDQFIDEVQ